MSNTITCPNCKHPVEITAAIRQELQERVVGELEKKHQTELDNIRKQNQQELETQKALVEQAARKAAIEKVRQEYQAKIANTKDESEAARKQNLELQQELQQLMKQLREERDKGQKLELEYQKKLLAEEQSIKDKAKKEAEEELTLRMSEKEKKLADANKQILELQRKLQQGSQQTQGEVLELSIEESFREQFPHDYISEVPKGIRGADIIQTVQTRNRRSCGTIVWEIKNTKRFDENWLQKLRDDTRTLKADVSALISVVLPEDFEQPRLQDGVWLCSPKQAVGLAASLRHMLIKVDEIKRANKGREEKADIVYSYLISNEFKQRIEVWVEYFTKRREEIDKERRYFMKKWDKEEKEVLKLFENTAGIYGDLQGMMGSALPEIKHFELEASLDE